MYVYIITIHYSYTFPIYQQELQPASWRKIWRVCGKLWVRPGKLWLWHKMMCPQFSRLLQQNVKVVASPWMLRLQHLSFKKPEHILVGNNSIATNHQGGARQAVQSAGRTGGCLNQNEVQLVPRTFLNNDTSNTLKNSKPGVRRHMLTNWNQKNVFSTALRLSGLTTYQAKVQRATAGADSGWNFGCFRVVQSMEVIRTAYACYLYLFMYIQIWTYNYIYIYIWARSPVSQSRPPPPMVWSPRPRGPDRASRGSHYQYHCY